MTASTAPTQPPDKCPACGEVAYKDKEFCSTGITYRRFECGSSFMERDNWIGQCAFFATSQLRAAAIALRAERDAALAQVKMFSDNEGGALTFHILRTWGREKLERFCLHLLGDDWQTLTARADHATEEVERLTLRLEQEQRNYKNCKSVLGDTEAELTAARARLAELQAALQTELPLLWEYAPNIARRIRAALASGAVIKGEVK